MSKPPTADVIQTWIQLHRAHRQLLDKVETTLKRQGLPPLDWYDVLLELQRAKANGLRQYEIGEKVLLNKHNLSRLLDRLQQGGLLERHACAEDGRGNLIKITAGGIQLLKKMWPVYSQVIQESFGAKLTAQDKSDLLRILTKLLA